MTIKRRLKKLEDLVDVEEKEPHIINFVPWDRPEDFNYDECKAYQREVKRIMSEPHRMGIIYTPCHGCKEECKNAK